MHSAPLVLRRVYLSLQQVISLHLLMWARSVSIYGECLTLLSMTRSLMLLNTRANRAQYAEVSWRTANEVEMLASDGVDLPSMQGTAEQEGLILLHSCYH